MIREKLLQHLIGVAKPIYDTLFKIHKKPWKITLEDLGHCPEYSLGKELFWFLKENNISIMEKFENHDVCHVLSGYATDCVSESCMQFFLLGTGKKSLFVLGTLIISIVVLPEHLPKYVQAFKRGLHTPYFDHLNFEQMLETPLVALQTSIMNRPALILL